MADQHTNFTAPYLTGPPGNPQAPLLLRPIPGWVPLGQSPNAAAGAIATPPLSMNVASATPNQPTTMACSHPGCHIQFPNVPALQAHAYSLKHMPFACQFCTHRFVSCNDHIRHLFNIHNSYCAPPCWPVCADCLLRCPDVKGLQKHGKEASHYPFKCFDCDDTRRACRTQSWNGLRSHQQIHHAEKYGENLLVE